MLFVLDGAYDYILRFITLMRVRGMPHVCMICCMRVPIYFRELCMEHMIIQCVTALMRVCVGGRCAHMGVQFVMHGYVLIHTVRVLMLVYLYQVIAYGGTIIVHRI